jgi:hypothetical protein
MRLPNGDRAVVEIAKLKDYCLNPSHPRGRHKARVFASRLGFTADDAATLRHLLLTAAVEHDDGVPSVEDAFGERYVLDFEVHGPKGTATVRSAWIIRAAEDFPRFTTCYVL